jgi:hypothetical protein
MNRRIRRAERRQHASFDLFDPDLTTRVALRTGAFQIRGYLIAQHKARIARALRAPSYDGVPRLANNSDRLPHRSRTRGRGDDCVPPLTLSL